MTQSLTVDGFRIFKSFLNPQAQAALVADVRNIVRAVPLFSPVTPAGKTMRVRMTSAGDYGWVSDHSGYRYSRAHPNGAAWPVIPKSVLEIWNAVSASRRTPECCLVNFYDPTARMGLHQDRDEFDFSQPVVSVSLGADALFRIGGTSRSDPTRSLWLSSGDVVVMAGEARLKFHGIDRLRAGSSGLLPKGGRLNLTLRVVT